MEKLVASIVKGGVASLLFALAPLSGGASVPSPLPNINSVQSLQASTDSVTFEVADGVEMSFYLSSNTAVLRSVKTNLTSVTIPDAITYSGMDYAVKYFGCYSNGSYQLDFTQSPSLKSITIPSTVNYIRTWGQWGRDNSDLELHMSAMPNSNNTYVNREWTIYVPDDLLSTFEGHSIYYSAFIYAEGHTPCKMTVAVAKQGELAQQLMELTDNDWKKINELTVTGTLNSEDLEAIKRLTRLTKLDLTGTDITSLPESFKSGDTYQNYLTEVSLPASVTSIGNSAFYNCYHLRNISMPGVISFGSYAFYNTWDLESLTINEGTESLANYLFEYSNLSKGIKLPSTIKNIGYRTFEHASLPKIELNEGLTSIGNSAFYNCTKLTSIVCPSTLTTISGSAFESCTSLEKVELNEGLTTMSGYTFENCTSLTSITLPSTLTSVGGSPFKNCSNLTTVTCRSVLPPSISSSPLYGCDMTGRTLYVHAVSVDKYRATSLWNDFITIKPLTGDIATMNINQTFSIDDASTLTGKPTLNITSGGHLTVDGTATFALGAFNMTHYKNNYYFDNQTYTSLVNTAPITVAGDVNVNISFYEDRWHFFSLPYDVKVSDIEVPDGTYWVIRKYSGENRATGNGDTWLNMTNDSTLKANEGYILQCRNNSNNASSVTFKFPAASTASTAKMFPTGDVNVPLREYTSEFSHNKSWNLVGNPYLAFYDTRDLTFESPITVWNGSGYTAYSPQDDSYILTPTEAFFVQRPDNDRVVGFTAEGRQHDRTASSEAKTMRFAKSKQVERTVMNFTLAGNDYTDRARLVLNENASTGYETSCDASKFMSSDTNVPQLFLNEKGVLYAIDERPLTDGQAVMGLHVGESGTYTLSLASQLDGYDIEVTDTETGKTFNLSTADYTFYAQQETNNSRFTLCIKKSGDLTGIAKTVNSQPEIAVSQSHISVIAPIEAPITVYTADGRTVYSQQASSAELDVQPGVYVVKVGDKVSKVSVK